ncbi:MAG: hypothetical protein LC781_22580 [Actinobacteria bacterium]|nr:hypothetical protein [Actinomycetota bacterium]
MVCGPTASGKSELSDALAERMTAEIGARVPTLVVDSMQVYREIPTITNQARRRPAELISIVSVVEEVEDQTRRIAQRITASAPNPRRTSREKELELAEAPDRGSIWDAEIRYGAIMIYLRPDREKLDTAILRRSERIVRDGLEEAAKIRELTGVNASVIDSIGVRELVEHLEGKTTIQEARDQISTRTRRLARRQIRWFDKLARTLQRQTRVRVVENRAKVDASSVFELYAW